MQLRKIHSQVTGTTIRGVATLRVMACLKFWLPMPMEQFIALIFSV